MTRMREEELVDLETASIWVEGSMKLDDLNDILDLELSSEDYDSVGGLVIDRLEHLLLPGRRGGVRQCAPGSGNVWKRTVLTRFICTSFLEKKKRNRTKAKSRLNTKAETAHKMLAFWDNNIC